MENSSNKNVSIQLSQQDIDKLKIIFDQLGIKIPSATEVDKKKNTEDCTDEKDLDQLDNLSQEEDLLEPIDIEPEELQNDSRRAPSKEGNTMTDVTSPDKESDEDSEKISNNNETDNESCDENEITPDDILPSSDGKDDNSGEQKLSNNQEFDLVSDEETNQINGDIQTMLTSLKKHKTIEKMSMYNTIKPQKKEPLRNKKNIKDQEEQEDRENFEELKIEKKITLNVGGKKFNLKRKLLENFNINYSKLQKIIKEDGRLIYFLDRDPYYFSKIIDLIKIHGFDQNSLAENISDYSEQLINELCMYGLLEKKYIPAPKLKLKRIVTFPLKHDDIIKIIAGDQLFETSSGVLSRSNFFDNKLKMSRSKQFYLTDVNPKIFRYVLNFLRNGELYVMNDEIIDLLNNYGIEFERLEAKKINTSIVSHYLPHGPEAIQNQILGCISALDPRNYPVNKNSSKDNNFYQLSDCRYYYPPGAAVSFGTENINIITSNTPPKFDTEIVFNLTDPNKDFGECIEDLLVCIDIPVLNPIEQFEYIDLIAYRIIDAVSLIYTDGTGAKNLMQTNFDELYLHPIIYCHNTEDYHNFTKSDNKMKMLYDNNLIDIHRIIVPLFFFNRQNHLPIKKIMGKKNSAHIIVKITSLKNIFKNKTKEIPLLNVCLIANYANLFPFTQVMDKNNIVTVPVNTSLKNDPVLYVFNRTHMPLVPIETSVNPLYDTIIVPLDEFGFIKDFYFTIIEANDSMSGVMNKFADELIELEILNIKNGKNVLLHSKLDSIMLNQYIPLKKLGHCLPKGIYYYSFSSDPNQSMMLGGLVGSGYILRIKIKKTRGLIKFYINEYVREII